MVKTPRLIAGKSPATGCNVIKPPETSSSDVTRPVNQEKGVEAEEAYRIGLLNHLTPCAQLREKTLEIATPIATNRRESVMGIKELLLQDKGADMYQMWDNEREFTTKKVRGYGVEEAFPEFLAQKGRE